MDWFDPAGWRIYIVAFVLFHLAGLGFHVSMKAVRGTKGLQPLSLGRDLYGAGLFFYFFAILFIIGYGAEMASVTKDDETGKLLLSDVQDNFTFAMFVALKDVGATIGIVLGFLSLAWARFFEKSIGEGSEEKPTLQRIEIRCPHCCATDETRAKGG